MSKFKDLYAGAFFLCLSAVIYAASYAIHLTKADPIGPQFFPRLVAFAMAALSFPLIWKGLAALKAKSGGSAASESKKAKKPIGYAFLLSIALLVGYMLLVEHIGFILMSIVYLFCQIVLISPKEDLNKRHYVLFGAIALVVPVALYFVFYYAFNIFLPAGILG